MVGDSDTTCRKSSFLIYILMINYKHLKSKHVVCPRVGNAQMNGCWRAASSVFMWKVAKQSSICDNSLVPTTWLRKLLLK